MDIQLNDGGKLKIMVTEIKEGLYGYYVNGVKIGVFAPQNMEDNILILQNTLDNELSAQIKDSIDALDRAQIQQEGKETKAIQDYAMEIGIESVRDIYTIELPEREEENIEKNENEEEKEENKKGVTTRDVNIKQEIELSERANDMQDLRKWLGNNIPPEFTKVSVIDGNEMSKMTNEKGENYKNVSTAYALVLVDKNNNVEPLQKYIPNLQQRSASGNNPTSQKYQVNKDGSVEQDAILSEWELGDKIIQLDNESMGRIEVHIGREEHGGNETLGTQIRDSNSIYTTSTEMRGVMGEYEGNGEYVVDENLEEIKQHDPDCKEPLTYEDIDGDPNTKSHGYMTDEYVVDENGKKYTYQELATRWGKYDDGKPDVESIKELFEKERESGKTVKELIDDADEEYEDPRAPEGRM